MFIAVIYAVVLSGFIYLANNEYGSRGDEVQLITEYEGTSPPIDVTIVLHRIVDGENSVEASVFVRSDEWYAGSAESDKECLTVFVSDRSPHMTFEPKEFHFRCGDVGALSIAGGETPRFLIPSHAAVTLFPFDETVIWPSVRLETRDGAEAVRYHVVKRFPGQRVEIVGDSLNWEIRLSRWTNEKIIILLAGSIFVILGIFLAASLLRSGKAIHHTELMIAGSGYVLAGFGVREVLGLSTISRGTLFELAVFLMPLLSVLAVIAYILAAKVWRGR
ncbi:hypothetical protein E3U23_11055 [Erythrobacter litoralis]|uniref:hypothetical protein n=1 Tax=Erythrobacter litoralis TaxID=39960 RepID=UPI0024354442|nr:hypothetical protein [Erythrobacter litoralis]MDG6079726.1 hypothetical protein [Erythrobacter litoralis]